MKKWKKKSKQNKSNNQTSDKLRFDTIFIHRFHFSFGFFLEFTCFVSCYDFMMKVLDESPKTAFYLSTQCSQMSFALTLSSSNFWFLYINTQNKDSPIIMYILFSMCNLVYFQNYYPLCPHFSMLCSVYRFSCARDFSVAFHVWIQKRINKSVSHICW